MIAAGSRGFFHRLSIFIEKIQMTSAWVGMHRMGWWVSARLATLPPKVAVALAL